MADVLLGTMRSSARGDCYGRRTHNLLTRGNNVTTLLDRQRRPWSEGPFGGHTGHDERGAAVQRADDPELGLAGFAEGPGPDSDHDVEPDVEGADTALDEGVAREGGLARLVTPEDPAPAGFELGGRLFDGPFVGADHEDSGWRGPGLLDRGSARHRGQAGTPPRSQSCSHVPSVHPTGH